MAMPIKNLAGSVFGRLRVVSRAANTGHATRWLCSCECGTTLVVRTSRLAKGLRTHCGCALRSDLSGKRFGSWNVLHPLPRRQSGKRTVPSYLCRCLCGVEQAVDRQGLISGHSSRCLRCAHLITSSKLRGKGDGPWRSKKHVIDANRCGAKKRFLEHSLTDDEMCSIMSNACYYCGLPPSNRYTKRGDVEPFIYSGIDRVDNAVGYVPGNVVSCCWDCNRRKGSSGSEEFISWAKRVAAAALERAHNGGLE